MFIYINVLLLHRALISTHMLRSAFIYSSSYDQMPTMSFWFHVEQTRQTLYKWINGHNFDIRT